MIKRLVCGLILGGVILSVALLFHILSTCGTLLALVTIPCAMVSVALHPFVGHLWGWMFDTGRLRTPFAIVAALLLGTPFFTAAYYGTAYVIAAASGGTESKAIVERLYQETRYRTKRVSRRVVTRGTPYKVFVAELYIPSYRQSVKLDIKKAEYQHLSAGDSVNAKVSSTLPGVLVVHTPLLDAKPLERTRHVGPKF